MARGKAHKDETRAAVVADLLAGDSVTATAAAHGLPESTVRTWGQDSGIDFAELRAEKKEALVELISAYLCENLRTLRAQSIFFRSPTWLFRQPAGELAVLHGVMADKALRILEAAAAAEPLPGDPVPVEPVSEPAETQ